MENIILFDVLSYCVMFMCSDSLWTVAHCRQWERILREAEGRILKKPHFLIPEWQRVTNSHSGVQCLQNEGIFDWLSCTTEPKACGITVSYVNISRVSVNIRAAQTLPTVWCKERQTSGASQNYCQLFKKKTKLRENKNPYFTQVLITMTGAASKINTSLL